MASSFEITRTISSLALVAAIASLACNEGGHRHHSPTTPPDVIIGSGNLTRETRAVAGVNGVRLLGVGSVEIEQSGSESLVVEAEDNIQQFLTTEVIGGILLISQDPNVSLQPTRRIVFYLNVNSLADVELVGAGNIAAHGLSGDELEVRSLGVGSIELSNLSLRHLEIALTGVGSVRASGTTRTQRVALTGVGSYEGRHLESLVAEVELRSVGSATVNARDRLVAIVTGPGCIYYVGNPTIESSVTGVGCIRPID